MTFTEQFLKEAGDVIDGLDQDAIEKLVALVADTRAAGGRMFILGVGGSAGNASHAVNDFRKIVGIEAYAPTDNVSELTARTNDEGWATVFEAWLRVSRLRAEDMLLVFSVGGGSLEKQVSPNLVTALQYAKTIGAKVGGIVGRDGGYTAKVADACVLVPVVNPDHITPHSEAFQAVVWHLLVSHPRLKASQTKWEGVKQPPVRAVFLDRDGVLNVAVLREGRPYPPARASEMEIVAEAPECLRRLREAGYLLIVVTNQPDIARGTQTPETVEGIHTRLRAAMPLDAIYVCPHGSAEDCDCRKPKPGLLLRAASEWNVALGESFMIGDRWGDVDAGAQAGCRTVWLDFGYRERGPAAAPSRVA